MMHQIKYISTQPAPSPTRTLNISNSICGYEVKYQCDVLRFENVNWRQSILGTHQLTNLFHSGSFIGDGPAPRGTSKPLLSLPHWYLFASYTRLRPRTPTAERDALVARKQIAGLLLADIVLNNLANRRSCCERNSHYPPDQETRRSSSVRANQQSCDLLSAIQHSWYHNMVYPAASLDSHTTRHNMFVANLIEVRHELMRILS